MSKLSRIIRFRISEDDYSNYVDKVKQSGYNQSEFFRNIVLENKTKVINKDDGIKVVYHLNKMGNNLNQIAYKLNKAYLSGNISEEICIRNLELLDRILEEQKNIIDLVL